MALSGPRTNSGISWFPPAVAGLRDMASCPRVMPGRQGGGCGGRSRCRKPCGPEYSFRLRSPRTHPAVHRTLGKAQADPACSAAVGRGGARSQGWAGAALNPGVLSLEALAAPRPGGTEAVCTQPRPGAGGKVPGARHVPFLLTCGGRRSGSWAPAWGRVASRAFRSRTTSMQPAVLIWNNCETRVAHT